MTSIFSKFKKDDQKKGEQTKTIEVSPDQAKTVERLLENFQELDEEELINFIDNDSVLAKLTLKKRYEILELAKTYQQKLDNPEPVETEKQESETLDIKEYIRTHEFKNRNGNVIDLAEIDKLRGYKIGDKLKVRKGVDVRDSVRKAKDIIVVGFTSDEKIVLQFDEGKCSSDFVGKRDELYEKL